MAVFISVADESADQNPRRNFFYGGFAAPVEDWEDSFSVAWDERVLSGPPRIPYVHMTEMRSPKWREQHGISDTDASRRIDEASRVICSTGSLIPGIVSVNESDFNKLLRQDFAPKPNKKASLDPDYICFLLFAFQQLDWIHNIDPGVEKVDFWVERNGRITDYIRTFHETLRSSLEAIGVPHLAPLVGQLYPVDKTRIPAQAADVLAWHARNAENRTLSALGAKRYLRMTQTGHHGRYGHRMTISEEDLRTLAAAYAD